MSDRRIVHRICTLCEATCGIDVEVENNRLLSVRGDKLDPFPQGYICPKAHAMKQIHEDPDRLRRPLRPAVECPELAEAANDGDEPALDLDAGIATAQGKNIRFAAFPESLKQILDAGGLIPYIAKYVLPQQRAAKG